jgi:hypothetical protein
MTIMVVSNLRFFVELALAGLAQFREKEIYKQRVARLGRQNKPLDFKAEERCQRWLDQLPFHQNNIIYLGSLLPISRSRHRTGMESGARVTPRRTLAPLALHATPA